jgi:hypothetical protein
MVYRVIGTGHKFHAEKLFKTRAEAIKFKETEKGIEKSFANQFGKKKQVKLLKLKLKIVKK